MNIIIGLIEHMGDIVACEPVSRYIRHKYPDAKISWAVLGAYKELIDTNPNIDETIILECLTDWIKLSKHSKANSQIKIVDLHVNYRICSHCRVPLIKEEGNLFINAFEWLDYGALLEAFSMGAGLPKLSAQPRVYLNEQHRTFVDELQLPAQYCVIHRESNESSKDWPIEQWRQFAQWFEKTIGLAIVEVGTVKNGETSPFIGKSLDLRNRTSILQTAEVIRRARFFIGVDSGPAHLANAVQTPGVILLGKHGVFRQYIPYTAYYASSAPEVKIVRNLTGPARLVPMHEVTEAVKYVAHTLDARLAHDVAAPVNDQHVSPGQYKAAPEDRTLLEGSKYFDPSWYVLHQASEIPSNVDPLDHFLAEGGVAGFSPGPDFDSSRYLKANPELASMGMNPLVHMLRSGNAIDWPLEQPHHANVEDDIAAVGVPVLSTFTGTSNPAVVPTHGKSQLPKAFAFYLPQFHPIAENNVAHGMGFTEWNNVIKAKPLFAGHYQPKIPGELGYYDLRSVDTMRAQLELALEHGITGFCFYYYYFHGKKLLYKPIENYINSDMKAPFFFLWANENWSKRWDGGDNELIIEQQHSPEDDLAFLRELIPVFTDERYQKIHGKPLLLIYKTHLFPDIRKTTDLWRDEIVKHGFPGIYLVMVDDWSEDIGHPRQHGFDATYEIPSNIVPVATYDTEMENADVAMDVGGRLVDYAKFAKFHMSRPFPEYKRFRTVMLPWDNTARYGAHAMVHTNTRGDDYKLWLTQALLDSAHRYEPEERIVFLHSWNEWCEGTYLEPDTKSGRRYLQETKAALSSAENVLSMLEKGDYADEVNTMLRIEQEKDAGAYQLIKAIRHDMAHLHRVLIHERQNHKAMVADIHRSASWRITAPLRKIMARLRGH
jgi:ADP-heptose:LPS heptosyltransferase